MSENGNRRDPLGLPPPSFQLPDDIDDYELWTIRLPTSLDVTSLRGVEFQLPQEQQHVLGTFRDEDCEYGLTVGHSVENEQFRLLQQQDDMLRLFGRPFDRHVNVVHASALKEIPETELAPRLETAPVPVAPIRRSYSHIPQVSGLKRRWMPSGTSIPTAVATKVVPAQIFEKVNGIKHREEEPDSPSPETPDQNKSDVESGSEDRETPSQNKIDKDVASTPSLATMNGSEPYSPEEPDSKRMKHDETLMNGEKKSSEKKSKKSKAEKKAKKEHKREKKERKREKKEQKREKKKKKHKSDGG